MTVGKDVSMLFTHVLKCVETEDIELKKLVSKQEVAVELQDGQQAGAEYETETCALRTKLAPCFCHS